MNIGILTFHRAYNYGSALQAYALNRTLNSDGRKAETIDFRSADQDKMYEIFNRVTSANDILRNILSLVKYSELKRKKKRFDSFINHELKIREPSIYNEEELEKLNGAYDYFVCGSDQIWNTYCHDFSKAYMLDFVKDKSKCVAYAPSIGLSELNDSDRKLFSELLNGFKAISVREKQGAELIRPLLKQEVSVMPDPTVLLNADEWSKAASPLEIKGRYILGYYIGDVPGMRDFALQLSKKTDCRVVVINKNIRDLLYCNKKYYSAGPKEFISLIKNAEYICTDSFHAVMFSLIFHKNFWIFADQKKQNSSSRITNILSKVGLTQRMVQDAGNDLPMTEQIDYNGVDDILENMRQKALDYLNQNLI